MARKQTPDLMATLMGDKKKLQKVDQKLVKPSRIKVTFTENEQKIPSSREKTTFNMSKESIDRLEDNWMQLRRKLGRGVNKSLLVELALDIVFSDLEERKEKSELYVSLAEMSE